MKPIYTYITGLFIASMLLSAPSVYTQTSMAFAPQQTVIQNNSPVISKLLLGSTGYGNNVWTNDLYSVNTNDPSAVTIIGEIPIQTTSGDFHPEDDAHIYVIDINENTLVKIDIATGEMISSTSIPVPVDGGIWTVLSIHKSTGAFYGVASNGSESNVYEIDAETGELSFVFATGLPVIISGTFDQNGIMWLFEIENDSIYKFNITTLILELVGAAGFDGDSPQGMAYDVSEDQVYLAAYEKNVGPQLRLLSRSTGEATYLGNLPGETTAFGFPGGIAPIEHSIQIPAGWSGISSFVNPENPLLSIMLTQISDQLILLQDAQGALYWPQQNITSLENWNSTQGYSIYLEETATLQITGTPVENLTIEIEQGWNLIPVLSSEPFSVSLLFENFEGLIMVKDLAGTGVFWPEYGINTIVNLMPGKAYKVYTSEQGSVSYQQ